MAYQRKHSCYRCDGKGVGTIAMFQSSWEKDHPQWVNNFPCIICEGRGYNLYDFRPQKYKGTFKNVDWEKLDVGYEDFSASYTCECGGEIFFSESGQAVCNCGRAYKLSINLSVDETHLNDMKYWEEYDENKG